MTTFPASAACGRSPRAWSGTVTTTTSPARAASSAVAARACGPSSSTRSVSVSGPRLLLSTTSWPASTASRATVLPMLPLPMKPQVVMRAPTRSAAGRIPPRPASAPTFDGTRDGAGPGYGTVIDPPSEGDLRDPVRLHPDDRAERPPRARRRRGARRGRRLRPARVERPLLTVAHRAGARAVRVDGARCGRPRDEPGRPDDLRDLSDDALPPGRRGAEGRDPAAPGRGPVHAGPGQRREPQRARGGGRLARRGDPAGDARRGDPGHPRAAHRRAGDLPRRALRRRLGPHLGPARAGGRPRCGGQR